MEKVENRLFLAFVWIFTLCCGFVSIVVLLGARFMVFELDYSEEQRQAANIQAGWISFSGFVGLCLSTLLFANSIRIANFLSRILAGTPPE